MQVQNNNSVKDQDGNSSKPLLVAGLFTNQIKMDANKAREISEANENSLKELLYSIKANAERGMIEVTWSKKERVIREVELEKWKILSCLLLTKGCIIYFGTG